MFERLERNGRYYGQLWRDRRFTFFFGTRSTAQHDLTTLFPHYRFCYLRQVHGKAVVPATQQKAIEADGHFTSTPGLAVVVQTADCVPILLAAPNQVCALHAGWRGVALNIVSAAPGGFRVAALGPHIGVQSFEIGRDVAAQLLKAAPDSTEDFVVEDSGLAADRVRFDLRKLVRAQLTQYHGNGLNLAEYCVDTKASADHCSYRRDGAGAGRQFSFVVLNP